MATGGDLRQVWLGSIPSELTEAEVVSLLGRHGVRPYKVVLRSRPNQEHITIHSDHKDTHTHTLM